jgi:hypothetical protein
MLPGHRYLLFLGMLSACCLHHYSVTSLTNKGMKIKDNKIMTTNTTDNNALHWIGVKLPTPPSELVR